MPIALVNRFFEFQKCLFFFRKSGIDRRHRIMRNILSLRDLVVFSQNLPGVLRPASVSVCNTSNLEEELIRRIYLQRTLSNVDSGGIHSKSIVDYAKLIPCVQGRWLQV